MKRIMHLTRRHAERFRRKLRSYQGKSIGFRADEIIIANGNIARREYLTHPGAVGVLAFERPDRILLVKQYRYPVKEFTFEIPAGKLQVGENPGGCVRRELEEETGYRARRIRKLLHYWPTAAFSNEVIHLYLARDLYPTRMNPDEDEFLELVRVSPRQLDSLIRAGKIHDSKTLIAYLAWKALYR